MQIALKKSLIAGILLAILVGAFMTAIYVNVVQANVYNLYASSCLGGWENTSLAAGSPDASSSDEVRVFNDTNSARLIANSHAQIYCGDWSGNILPNTIPKKILVRFSWAVEYPSTPIEVGFEPVPLFAPEPTLESVPHAEEPFVSSRSNLNETETPSISYTTTTPDAVTKTYYITIATPDIATTTNDTAMITTTDHSYGLVEALYTLDGVTWKSLGFVARNEFSNKYFEIPIEEAREWKDISKIQIGIQSVPVLDSVAPVIYLDAVWIEVEYQEILEDPYVPPGGKDGDIILSKIQFENMAAVLVSRKSSILIGAPKQELWLTSLSSISSVAPVLDDASTTTSAIEFTPPPVKKEWRFVADNSILSENPRVLFSDGNIFWVGKNDETLWRFNPQTSGYGSVSFSKGESARLYFESPSGVERVLEASSETLETLLIIDAPIYEN